MNSEHSSVRVAARFCGPPSSANGGYVCGLVADAIGQLVTVRLLKPPPLDAQMTVHADADGTWHVEHDAQRIVEARPATLDDLAPPATVTYADALAASANATWSDPAQHPCPGCFVCGPLRARGDGLRLFAGPVTGRALVAAPWTPDDSLAIDGKVLPEHMFAALDCPGAFALGSLVPGTVLGTLSAHVDRRARAGKPHVVIGWRIDRDGRKCRVGTAIFDEDGDLCGRAEGVWILPREAAG